jgi:CheY-like chemotaxis protein
VVAISAAPEGYLREAKSLGADAVLAKPFDLETLSSVVQWFVA